MKYDDEFLKKVESLGILGYPVQKCINILDIGDTEVNQFTTDFNSPESKVKKAYQKGVDKAEYAIDSKLFNKAKEGDLKALQKFEDRQSARLLRGG